jgi:hypothetical protein
MIEIAFVDYNGGHFDQKLQVCSDFNKNNYRDRYYTLISGGYAINHNFDLTRNFMYDNELILNPTTSHKYFGIRDIGPK